MISTRDILALSSCKSLSDVTELDLSNRDLKVLDPCSFKGLKNLQSLDVSRNSLRDVPDLGLPKLRYLNVEENLINDLTFLKEYSELTELMIAGNPILSADKNIAVSLLPKLTLLDGADCQPLRKLEALGDKKLLPQISQIWKSTFKNNLVPGADEEEISLVKKDFLRHLRRSFIECNEFPVKFKKFKVEALGEQLFEEEVRCLHSKEKTPRKKENEAKSVRESPQERSASPVKKPSSAKRAPAKKKSILDGPEEKESSPQKRICGRNGSTRIDSAEIAEQCSSPRKKLKYEASAKAIQGPVKGAEVSTFLRCHSKDPNDSVTQVWQAAFQPTSEESDISPSIVATCGGRVVNFIDCSTGTVVKRYRHANSKEEFFCLAWTLLPIGGRPSAVLAVAGKAREVSLIHPEQLVCYRSFEAHSKYINCLRFCPGQPSWLLSGSIDDNIHIWNVGIPEAPKYQTKIEKLVTLKPKCEILQLCISTRNELLLAACHGGLFAWKFDQKSVVKMDRSPNIEFRFPTKDGASEEREPVVDGLVLIQDDTIVSKCSNSGMIGTWKLSGHLTSLKKHSQKLQRVRVQYASTFRWSDTRVDYFYPSATPDLIACGDDTGSVWLYRLGKKSETLAKPLTVLAWPDKLLCGDDFCVQKKDGKVNANSVTLSPDGNYMVVCTDVNIVCIWRIVH